MSRPGTGDFAEKKEAILRDWESRYLKDLLKQTDGNMSGAAKISGMARGHLYRLVKKYGLKQGAFR